jgi:hypothetical protein
MGKNGVNMIDKIHDHIVSELGHSSRTDTIFVITAIIFNLIVLGVNSGISAASVDSDETFVTDLVLVVFIVMTLLINGISVVALNLGRRTRKMLLDGLVEMYRDHGADKYYNLSLITNYGVRYILFSAVIITLGLTAIIVPLIVRLL